MKHSKKYEDQPFVQLSVKSMEFVMFNDKNCLSQIQKDYYNYVLSVNLRMLRIEETLKTLKHCRVFLAERHPSLGKRNFESSISIADYTRYHIENYFLRITTYKDQIFHLLNAVFGLAVEKGMGFNSKVLKKAKARKIDKVEIINKSLNTLMSSTIDLRNRLAHEGVYDDEDIGLLESGFNFVNQFPNDERLKEDKMVNVLKKYLSNNIFDMIDNEKEMADYFFFVMDLIYNDFNFYLSELKKRT